ncbi:UvrD/REP helicase [[Clostridium] cellulosi]|uniref:DNA 3'-5' helicase n=1 Tax=[Clostridium] cellulosi TaxID=29343 RepID=A0A078KNM4_9FIRM|nr:UvrD/REP helicase [[Clostridium] cellulosi]
MPENINTEFIKLRKEIMEADFSRLNDMQRQAVFHTKGPLLILAGAGSGKTTVLVNRIACILKYGNAYESEKIEYDVNNETLDYLRDCLKNKRFSEERLSRLLSVGKVPAWSVMAITFTNKAANELKERLSSMLGDDARDIWACTFHSACSRILRRDIDKLDMGYTGSFTIYDTDDSVKLIRQFVKDVKDEKSFASKVVLPTISRAKEKCLDPKEFASISSNDSRMDMIAKIYEKYQQALRRANALDFDDMIMLTVKLFEKRPDVLEYYQHRFKYILVDEYQDTNHAQYRLVSLLADKHRNICVVGDDDQSIYRFRGATIENILSFEKQYPDAKVIKLEQNYRSTSTILNAANEVIANNKGRKGKILWTKNGTGEKIDINEFEDESSESQYISNSILENVKNGAKFSDHAILYRMNAQSGAIEKALVSRGIPYRIIGGFRFYERMEIKDILAYLCVINNKDDDLHFERIVNVPKRGIGNATLEAAHEISDRYGISLYEVFKRCDEFECFSRKAVKIKSLINFFEEMRSASKVIAPHELITEVIEKSGYLAELESDKSSDSEERIQNLNTLISNAADYEKNQDEPTLSGFLEETSLMTDLDNYDENADTVVLMTVHSAKGLEFPIVYIAGMEDGIFPNQAALSFPEEMEEERRLAYVAITRAKEKLNFSYARSRMIFGKTVYHRRSRFIDEIPEIYVNEHTSSREQIFNAFKPAKGQFGKQTIQTGGLGIGQKAAHTEEKYQAGDIVVHDTFGKGIVLSAKAMGNDMLLEIAFERFGTKKIMANFAKLKRA